jgi:hypothetical protein
MKVPKSILLPAAAALLAFAGAAPAKAQVSFGVTVGGPPPVCPYGYYDYSPYQCAPYGYYGPEWFTNGAFIGAGPWFHGRNDFRGHVDSHYDPRYGYHGNYPEHGGYREPNDHFHNFHGQDVHNGHAYVSRGGGEHHDEHPR